jgi:hypothetical protein
MLDLRFKPNVLLFGEFDLKFSNLFSFAKVSNDTAEVCCSCVVGAIRGSVVCSG